MKSSFLKICLRIYKIYCLSTPTFVGLRRRRWGLVSDIGRLLIPAVAPKSRGLSSRPVSRNMVFRVVPFVMVICRFMLMNNCIVINVVVIQIFARHGVLYVDCVRVGWWDTFWHIRRLWLFWACHRWLFGVGGNRLLGLRIRKVGN